jgi:hypothetical protein
LYEKAPAGVFGKKMSKTSGKVTDAQFYLQIWGVFYRMGEKPIFFQKN